VMNTGSAEAHRTDSCLLFFRDLSFVRAGAGRSTLTTVTAFVLVGMRRNIFWIRPPGTTPGIAVTLFRGGRATLFLLSPGWHNISDRYLRMKQRTCRSPRR
jgi:hypothetical protein